MKTLIHVFTIFCISAFISCGSPDNNREGSESDTVQEGTVSVGVDAEEDMYEKADHLISAHKNSELQIALGKVADQRSSSPELQEFGRRIVIENKQIQNNISELASAADMQLERALTPEYINMIDSIQSYSGREFDAAFLEILIEEHDEDIDRFMTLAQEFSNPIIRNLITDNLDILRRQKADAEELKDRLNLD